MRNISGIKTSSGVTTLNFQQPRRTLALDFRLTADVAVEAILVLSDRVLLLSRETRLPPDISKRFRYIVCEGNGKAAMNRRSPKRTSLVSG